MRSRSAAVAVSLRLAIGNGARPRDTLPSLALLLIPACGFTPFMAELAPDFETSISWALRRRRGRFPHRHGPVPGHG